MPYPLREDPKLRLKRNLRAARLAAGVTVVEAAKAVEMSRQSVTAWERFEPTAPVPSDQELERLAKLFNTDAPRLRYGNSPMPIPPGTVEVAKYLRDAGYQFEISPAIVAGGRGYLPDLVVFNPDVEGDSGTVVEVRGVLSRRADEDMVTAVLEDGHAFTHVDPSDPEGMRAAFPPTSRAVQQQPMLFGLPLDEVPAAGASKATRHERNLPLSIREYLAALQLRLTKGGATEEEVSEAMDLLRAPQLFTFYKGGVPSEYSEDDVLLGVKAIAEGVIIPVLRERGRKIR